MQQRITIIRYRKPTSDELNAQLQWLGNSLGLFGERDKDRSCFRLFIELVSSSRKNESLTSDELAHKLHLTRATIVHHLHKLLDAGLIVREQNRYVLRDRKLQDVIEDMRKDMDRAYVDLLAMAKDIDTRLGL